MLYECPQITPAETQKCLIILQFQTEALFVDNFPNNASVCIFRVQCCIPGLLQD